MQKKNISKTAYEIILVALFLLLLILPTIGMILQVNDNIPILENRELAGPPGFPQGLKDIENYPKQYESFWNDRFGFRNMLIKLNNMISVKYLSFSPHPKVILGKDGWLYYTGERERESFLKYEEPLSEEVLTQYQGVFEEKNKWFQQKGIQYYVVIPPDKHKIYPEYLPEHTANILLSINEFTHYEQLVKHMRSNSDSDFFIDVKTPLLRQKDDKYLVYYKTDSHWNRIGVFIAYQQIFNKISEDFPGLKPKKLTEFDIKTVEYSGDTAGLLAMNDFFKEEDFLVTPINPEHVKTTYFEDNYNGIPISRQFIVSECGSCSRSAVIIRDSYAEDLIPLISQHFAKVIYIDVYEDRDSIYKIIKSEKPDIVIEEIVDRVFDYLIYSIPETKRDILKLASSKYGIYDDNWTSKTASLIIEDTQAGKVLLKGYIPLDDFKKAYDNSLKILIKANGENLAKLELSEKNINDGTFIIEFDVPENTRTKLEIILDKTIVPSEHNINNDSRELGIYIIELSVKEL